MTSIRVAPGEVAQRLYGAIARGATVRLRHVKRRYDPDNPFRLNQNIPPA